MRSTRDRIRHTISFEVLGVLLITPLGVWVFGLPLGHMGVVSVVSATIATAWNYIYNLIFDLSLRRIRGHTQKTLGLRVVHAIVFETGLLVFLVPMLIWYLEVGLWHALTMDAGIAVFYVVYAFVFNWIYDRLFPLPEWADGPAVCRARAR